MTLAWVEDNYVDTSSERIIDLEEFLRLRITDAEWAIELELRRAHTVRFLAGNWITIRAPRRFTMEECERMHRQGRSVPLDLVPHEFWSGGPEFRYMGGRFTEEALGADF